MSAAFRKQKGILSKHIYYYMDIFMMSATKSYQIFGAIVVLIKIYVMNTEPPRFRYSLDATIRKLARIIIPLQSFLPMSPKSVLIMPFSHSLLSIIKLFLLLFFNSIRMAKPIAFTSLSFILKLSKYRTLRAKLSCLPTILLFPTGSTNNQSLSILPFLKSHNYRYYKV